MTREECCAVVSEKEMPMTVYDMVAAMQEKFASRPAFRWVDDATTTVKEKTYGEYVADIRKMTGYLQETVADLEAPKPSLNDADFNAALEQLNAGAIDKAYILDGYTLTDAQRIAVEAQ